MRFNYFLLKVKLWLNKNLPDDSVKSSIFMNNSLFLQSYFVFFIDKVKEKMLFGRKIDFKMEFKLMELKIISLEKLSGRNKILIIQ